MALPAPTSATSSTPNACASLSVSLRFIYATFLRPPESLRSHCGPWAVVTGATDGIALALALHLARSNLSLVLVGRNSLKLQSTSAEILSKFPNSKIQIVVIDFSGDLVGDVENLIESDLGGDLGEQCWGFVPLR